MTEPLSHLSETELAAELDAVGIPIAPNLIDLRERVDDWIARTAPLIEPDRPTWRTLADIDDAPSGELLFGMYEPAGPTLLCAAGGVGKGSTGAHHAVECQRLGLTPVIYDAERRPREWARRVSGLGGDRGRVVYIEPSDLPKPLLGRPLWDVAPHLGRVVAAAGGDVLFVDSILPAVGVGEERLRTDAQAPYLYVAALDALGIPSVSFAHPPKGQPDGDPFGSVAWVNAARLTWGGTLAEGDGHRVRWRPRKRNERGHIPGVLLTFDYGPDGRLAAVTREDDDESTRDWLLRALVDQPRTAAELADELVDELDAPAFGEVDRAKARLSRALRRMAREGWVIPPAKKGGRNATWALKAA